MLRSMYAGVSGLRSHQTMMDTVGHNIANVNTTGFKTSRTTFAESMVQTMRGATGAVEPGGGDGQGGVNPYQLGLGARVAGTDQTMNQGALQDTGRGTDLAINGEGFFVVEDGEGGERSFTRHGAFSIDEEGSLVDSAGRLVLDENEDPVNIYEDAAGTDIDPADLRSFSIGDDGTITGVDSAGDAVDLGQIALATFANPEGLERVGGSQYVPTENSGEAVLGVPGDGVGGSLQAGALEGSNVDLAQEFTNLIIAQRGFQANSRSITTSDEMLQELVQMKR